MTIQPLHQQLQGNFQVTGPNTGKVVLAFPPVPQGLVWTGSITVSSPFGNDPQGIVWTLMRNGTPIQSGHEWPVFTDIQGAGLETLELIGAYIGAGVVPSYPITATWTGWSGDASEIPATAPSTTGSTRGIVQVYNTQGVGGALEVIPWPVPSSVQFDINRLSAPSTSGPLLGTPTNGWLIWELMLQVSASQLSTVTGAQQCVCQIQDSAGNVLLDAVVNTLPNTTDSAIVRMPFRGLHIPAQRNLKVVAGAYGGTNLSVVGTVVAQDHA